MGNLYSGHQIIQYSDAYARCSKQEHQRWNRAFKRVQAKDVIDKRSFYEHVFVRAIPEALSDRIFEVLSGGTNTMVFSDLFCGLVLLTKGTKEEKLKFLYELYCGSADNNYKAMDKFLHDVTEGVEDRSNRKKKFAAKFENKENKEKSKVAFEEWCQWLEAECPEFPFVDWLHHGLQLVDEEPEEEEEQLPVLTVDSLLKSTAFAMDELEQLFRIYDQIMNTSPAARVHGMIDRSMVSRIFTPTMDERLATCVARAFFTFSKRTDWMTKGQFVQGLNDCCLQKDSNAKTSQLVIAAAKHSDKISRTVVVQLVTYMWNSSLYETDTKEERDKGLEEMLNSVAIMFEKFRINTADADVDEESQIQPTEELVLVSDATPWLCNLDLSHKFWETMKQSLYVLVGLRPQPRDIDEESLIQHLLQNGIAEKQAGDTWYALPWAWWHAWTEYMKVQKKRRLASTSNSNNAGPERVGDKPNTSATNASSTTNGAQNDGNSQSTSTASTTTTTKKSERDHREAKTKPPPLLDIKPITKSKKSNYTDWAAHLVPSLVSQTIVDDSHGLKSGLVEGQDFILLPWLVYDALVKWYGIKSDSIPLKVIADGSNLVVETYPLSLTLEVEPSILVPNRGYVSSAEFYFSKLLTLSKLKDKAGMTLRVNTSRIRLWLKVKGEKDVILEERLSETLDQARIRSGQSLIVEVQDSDGKWPRGTLGAVVEEEPSYPITPGITGLRNIGNTCYMNSSLQCLSNTEILTEYFLSEQYLDEINEDNVLGTGGVLSKQYGKLIADVWPEEDKKSVSKNYVVTPKEFKDTLCKFAPQFEGNNQHDSQELLGFILDGLHEDLNRIKKKPYTQNPEYEGQSDEVLSDQFWKLYLQRNQSIIVDLFFGQLKSTTDLTCGHKMVNFDPFSFLQLPLPVDTKRAFEVFFFCLDPNVKPQKISVLLSRHEGKTSELLANLETFSKVPKDRIAIGAVRDQKLCRLFTPQTKLADLSDIIYAFEMNSPLPYIEDEAADDTPPTNVIKLTHRRVTKNRTYFFSPFTFDFYSTPSLLDLARGDDQPAITNKQLYERVYNMFKKMIPNKDFKLIKNDAEKCVFDNLFEIRIVNDDGTKSVGKAWHSFSFGEKVPCNDEAFAPNANTITVDWLCDISKLKFNSNHGGWFEENESVKKHWEELNSPISLEQCINWYTQKETLSDEIYCSKCQAQVHASKMMELYALPNFLIIHLKRFVHYNNNWIKSNRLVNFPLEGLDPSTWLLKQRGEGEPELLYDLYATVNHSGRLGSGHYTAFAKKDEQWRCYNDSFVTEEADPSVIVSPTAYLLFYRRRGVKPENILRQTASDKEKSPQVLREKKAGQTNTNGGEGSNGASKPRASRGQTETCFVM